jgi:alkanesulfonate monooxygenase SsuD/methylene tetrahydromethanopterin reductase-like flavin-dependent oxidoreductase (luciferase family)
MEFGYYLTCYYPDGAQGFDALVRDTTEQAAAAEALGFTSLSIPEHHFANYLTIPSPLLLATHVAQRTEHVPIVTAVLVLPFYDPLRLAGEITLADNLTGGRIELGLGRGAFKYEFDQFAIPVAESRPRFEEMVTLLHRLLTEADVTFEGRFHSIREPITIMPPPLQRPRPPFWIASLSEQGIKGAVHAGHNVLTTPLRSPFEVAEQQAAWFIEARDRRPEGAPAVRHHMLRNVYVSKDRRDLQEKADLLLGNHRRFVNLFETDGTIERGYTVPLDSDIEPAEAANNVIFGTPDEVIERLRRHADLGIDGVQVNMAFGASQRDILASLELFAAEVMPELASSANLSPSR